MLWCGESVRVGGVRCGEMKRRCRKVCLGVGEMWVEV